MKWFGLNHRVNRFGIEPIYFYVKNTPEEERKEIPIAIVRQTIFLSSGMYLNFLRAYMRGKQ